jgi:hypothetical protein
VLEHDQKLILDVGDKAQDRKPEGAGDAAEHQQHNRSAAR